MKFLLPDLGEGLQEAEVLQWHVRAGDSVAIDQVLVSVETAKAIVDIPAPKAGVIDQLFVQVGEMALIGAALLSYKSADENKKQTIEKTAPLETESQAPPEPKPDNSTVVGQLPTNSCHEASVDDFIIGAASHSDDLHPHLTPALRALAASLKVDINKLQGHADDGHITQADIEAAAQQSNQKIATPPDQNRKQNTAISNHKTEKLQGPRRTMAKVMSLAHSTVAAATLVDDADISDWHTQGDPSARLCRGIARACAQNPDLNAHFNGDDLSRTLLSEVNLGIALDSADGLFVPVIRAANTQSLEQIRALLNHFKTEIANRSISPADMQGASITLSNFGAISRSNESTASAIKGGRYGTPIVVPPQVAIIAAGRISAQPSVVNGEVQARRLLPLSLSFDHRCVSGAEAARFLAALIHDLEMPT